MRLVDSPEPFLFALHVGRRGQDVLGIHCISPWRSIQFRMRYRSSLIRADSSSSDAQSAKWSVSQVLGSPTSRPINWPILRNR